MFDFDLERRSPILHAGISERCRSGFSSEFLPEHRRPCIKGRSLYDIEPSMCTYRQYFLDVDQPFFYHFLKKKDQSSTDKKQNERNSVPFVAS